MKKKVPQYLHHRVIGRVRVYPQIGKGVELQCISHAEARKQANKKKIV